MGWESILGTVLLFAGAGGVVAGMNEQAADIARRDIRHDDHNAALLARAQDNERLLRLVVDLAGLKKAAPKLYTEMHKKLGELLHLEETLDLQPRKASWGDAANFYYADVRTACKKLVRTLVKIKQKDMSKFPNAAELVEKLNAVQKQAKDSAWNINQRNLLIHAP
jgi:hypothetical protein